MLWDIPGSWLGKGGGGEDYHPKNCFVSKTEVVVFPVMNVLVFLGEQTLCSLDVLFLDILGS